MVGQAGDGTSKDGPLKLVLLLTDGVQSERNWVLQDNSGIRFPTAKSSLQTVVTPINSKWCKQVKDLNATIGVLYTEYLPMTWDWGYNATLGKTMASSGFSSIWGGTIASGKSSNTRTAYIPKALEECATSSDLFLQASLGGGHRGGSVLALQAISLKSQANELGGAHASFQSHLAERAWSGRGRVCAACLPVPHLPVLHSRHGADVLRR